MIPLIVSGALALGSSIASAIGKSQEQKKQAAIQRKLEEKQKKIESEYANMANTRYLDTAEGRGMINTMRENMLKSAKIATMNNARNNASAEMKVAHGSAINADISSTTQRIAEKDSARREGMRMKLLDLENQNASQNADYAFNRSAQAVQSWNTLQNNAMQGFVGALACSKLGGRGGGRGKNYIEPLESKGLPSFAPSSLAPR